MATRRIILHVDIETCMSDKELLQLLAERDHKWWYLQTKTGRFGPVSLEIEELQD